jgi:digeranylgeranylglycerophospholipid reductase
MLRTQKAVPRVPPRILAPAIRAMGAQRFVNWSFDHYLNIAPPSFAAQRPPARRADATLAA